MVSDFEKKATDAIEAAERHTDPELAREALSVASTYALLALAEALWHVGSAISEHASFGGQR